MMKKYLIMGAIIAIVSVIAAQCGPAPTPETITKVETVVIEKEVKVVETVEVEKEVEVKVAGETLQFWSTEVQPARAEKTKEILNRFEEQSGIHVELILTDENALPELTTAAVAAGTLPDVMFHPIDFTIGWAEQGILDPAAAAAVIEKLGPETFAEGPLNLAQVEGGYAAIPTDGWGQIIVYRADWFEAKGLEPPTSFEAIEAAAQALHDPANNIYGITAATKAGEVFTQQTFEHFALANGCQLVNEAGEVMLNTPQCVEAVEFFTNLLRNYGPPGDQDVASTRATYFAGQAGMVVWSPFILDEMAGLRDNAFPSCPECAEDPAYLAKNSGIVPAFAGPSGAPAQYGQVSYMGIATNANVEVAQAFLEFWFNEGYLDWLSVSPEGKFPMRRGTPAEPTQFIDGWKELETGVDRKAKLGSIYGDEVINTLIEGAGRFDRWGFAQGQGALITAVYEALPVPQYLRETIDEVYTPEEAVEQMQADVEELAASLQEQVQLQ
ncbi:MAG TPA: extracellular solute-binding protein [Anaerolineae bacterium]|nr:extracellular solute-binding protein [Anaerolineae bacterium]